VDNSSVDFVSTTHLGLQAPNIMLELMYIIQINLYLVVRFNCEISFSILVRN
jgi:hypothetical protein